MVEGRDGVAPYLRCRARVRVQRTWRAYPEPVHQLTLERGETQAGCEEHLPGQLERVHVGVLLAWSVLYLKGVTLVQGDRVSA